MLTMPPLLEEEAFEIGDMLGVEHSVIEENLNHMTGITRYLLEPGFAKRKVEEAVVEVNTSSISKMVSMQASNRAESCVMVHSLVLWKVGSDFLALPSFELVSRFAEKLVAKKLCLEAAAKLKSVRQDMAPLSGAEGYCMQALSLRHTRSERYKQDVRLTCALWKMAQRSKHFVFHPSLQIQL